ncbi:MAG TPA: hypothetical protein VJN18_02450 [Polyangiaceae bacterium]|nr:hypothetical protein [Polyangiaceae bacterium]
MDEPQPNIEHVSPPPKARATALAGTDATKRLPPQSEAVLMAAGPAWQTRALRELTPELLTVFRLSGAVSDQANQSYDSAVAAIRGDARQLKALRAFYDELPIAAYTARQQVVLLAGLAGTSDEVPMLEKVTMTPLPAVVTTSLDRESEQPTPIDQQSELRNAAVVSLSRIAQRGDKAALEALIRLLSSGDKLMATLSAVELAESGKLGAAERSVLVSRGIRGSFAKLDFEETFKIDSASTDGNTRSKPATVPPPAP